MFVGKYWWAGGANTGWRYEGQFKNGVENGPQGTKWKPDGSEFI